MASGWNGVGGDGIKMRWVCGVKGQSIKEAAEKPSDEYVLSLCDILCTAALDTVGIQGKFALLRWSGPFSPAEEKANEHKWSDLGNRAWSFIMIKGYSVQQTSGLTEFRWGRKGIIRESGGFDFSWNGEMWVASEEGKALWKKPGCVSSDLEAGIDGMCPWKQETVFVNCQ